MKVLAARPELCTVCRVCESVCAETFFKDSSRELSTIRVNFPDPQAEVSIEFCSQCGECIHVCPPQALYRSKNGIVRLRKEDCVGCMACVAFCPTLTLYVREGDPLPFKCIACGKCAKVCPTDALYMVDVEVPAPVTEMTRSVMAKRGEGSHGH